MHASGSANHFHERSHDWQSLPEKKRGGAFANRQSPESVTRCVSEGRAQRGVPPLSTEHWADWPGYLLGANSSQSIERRTPSLTRRVVGSITRLDSRVAEPQISCPVSRATSYTSLSPRPERHTTITSLGERFLAFSSAWATACELSMAGRMPSCLATN